MLFYQYQRLKNLSVFQNCFDRKKIQKTTFKWLLTSWRGLKPHLCSSILRNFPVFSFQKQSAHNCFRNLTFFSVYSEKHGKPQGWWALFEREPVLIFSESRMFRTKKFNAQHHCLRWNQLWISAVQRCISRLWNIDFLKLIYSDSALMLTRTVAEHGS